MPSALPEQDHSELDAGGEEPIRVEESGAAGSSSTDRWFAQKLLRMASNPAVCIELWDGTRILPEGRQEPFEITLRLTDRGALYRLLYRPMLTFGELYTEGRLQVDGDVCRALEIIYEQILQAELTATPVQKAVARLRERKPKANTLEGSRRNIHTHYDLGNDFYRLWLDRDYMQYTCAYYPNPAASLEEAQAAKLELVARKLALRPGETVVEAGSGWGGLARYFAKHHGVKVRSYNISAEQVKYARERARAEGLEDRVEYIEDDYRNIDGRFDAFVSVGMLEHVGADNYRALGATIDRCLKDDGRGLVHSIGQTRSRPLNEWIQAYIFPGAYPPTLREMMEIFEPVNLTIADVENLRPHYAQTLRHWRERYQAERPQVEAMFDRNFARAWYLYLSGSISAFTCGQLQLFQVLFRRPDRGLPLATRAPWLAGLE